MLSVSEKCFISWLVTQKNMRGTYYLERVAHRYAICLRSCPEKLDMVLPINDRNVFSCQSVDDFDALNSLFQTAPNFKEINRADHGSFAAGLSAYRRYLQYMEDNPKSEISQKGIGVAKTEVKPSVSKFQEQHLVDFAHPEFCTGCDPVTCIVEGKNLSGGNWRDVFASITEYFLQENPRANELYRTNIYPNSEHAFFLKEKPNLAARQLSNGYWINVNLSIKDLVFSIGKLCEFCRVDLNNVKITYAPKQNVKKAQSKNNVRSGQKSTHAKPLNNIKLQMLTTSTIPVEVIKVLNKNYSSGFRFEATYINLLSSVSGVAVDESMQAVLKSMMFHRDDNIYFLIDNFTDALTRKEIINSASSYLEEYGCFEISELYKQYENRFDAGCIRNSNDFESFFEQIYDADVRCVQAPQIGNRIVRYSNSAVWSLFKDIANKIVSVITEEYYGSCNEDDLHTKFCAFSTDLIGKIIKQCASDELICVEINDNICYQTFDALGLPENFSETLAEALEQLCDIGLDPTQDVLHTTLSLKLRVNIKAEYNLPDWDTYRRLIAKFYNAEPRREWKNNIFVEAND